MRSGEKDVIIYPWYTVGVTRFDLPDVLVHLGMKQQRDGRSEGKQRAREIQAVLRG